MFGDIIHFFSTDLKFNRCSLRADHRGMKALVAVTFRNGDKVFKARLHGFVHHMQGAQRAVAVFTGGDDHAETVKIEHFREGKLLDSHLVVDTVTGLLSTQHSAFNIGTLEHALGVVENFFECRAAVNARSYELFVKYFIAQRVIILQTQILQFTKSVVNTQVVSHWHIDIKRFFRNAAAFFRAHHPQRSEIMKAVGKLHENHTNVFTHG